MTRGRGLIFAIGGAVAVGLVSLVLFRLAGKGPDKPGPLTVAPAADPFLQRPAAFVTDIVASEGKYDELDPHIKRRFIKGLRTLDWATAESGLTVDFLGSFPALTESTLVPDGRIRLRTFKQQERPLLDRATFLSRLREMMNGWTMVERTTWRTFEFLADKSGSRAYAQVHFQVAGQRAGGGRADFNASLQVVYVADTSGTWRIRDLGLTEGYLGECDDPPFEDITDITGFHFNVSAENKQIKQAIVDDRTTVVNGGLSVVDWNHDGFWDVFATEASSQTVLLMNDGEGGFIRSPSPVPDGVECGFNYLAVDLDNDGVEELVGSQILDYQGTRARACLYVREGDRWSARPRALEFEIPVGTRDINVQGIVPHDIDGNGYLDLYFCAYETRDSGFPNFNHIAAFDGADNLLFMNHGGLRFTEESDKRGIHGTQYTYCAKFFDFDEDGDVDLFEGNDFGPDILYLNKGDGTYEPAKDHVFIGGCSYTMGVTWSDFDNTGEWSMYISNMYSHAGNRIVPLAAELSPEMKKLALNQAQGNFMYEFDRKTKTWRETGIERGVNWADWAWACIFWDPDNDTDKDIFVANGYTSHQDKTAPDY